MITDIPENIKNEFLTFLNDHIHNTPKLYNECSDRKPHQVSLLHSAVSTYTIIDFDDNVSLIIPSIYDKFINTPTPI